MYLNVIQCSIGHYNLLSNDKSLSFSMILTENENSREAINIDGINAMLYYSGDPDELEVFIDAYNNLEEVFEKCFTYAIKTWSTVNYRAQCLLFFKLFQENYTEINAYLVKKHVEDIKKKIIELNKQLERTIVIPDLSEIGNYCLDNRISEINNLIALYDKDLVQFRENSDNYNSIKSKIDKYRKEVELLSNSKISL